MEPELITYQKFNDAVLANELIEVLEKHNIPYHVEEQTSGFDPSLVMSNATVDYAVKIKSDDFEEVNRLLKEKEEKNIDDVPDDYYLFSFTGEELMEVITKADEWSAFDVVLARKLLAEKGLNIDDKKLAAIKEKRIAELRAPDKPQTLWITIGYICAFGGGILGIFIGWYLSSGKKTLPDGERVYEYSEQDRKHGRNIFYIGIIATIIFVSAKFLVTLNT